MNAVVHVADFAGGTVHVRAHTARQARRLAERGSRLAAAVACPETDRLRIRAWPVTGALPYLTIDLPAAEWEAINRLLLAVQRAARTPLRASVAAGDGAPSRTWDGAWQGATGAVA